MERIVSSGCICIYNTELNVSLQPFVFKKNPKIDAVRPFWTMSPNGSDCASKTCQLFGNSVV